MPFSPPCRASPWSFPQSLGCLCSSSELLSLLQLPPHKTTPNAHMVGREKPLNTQLTLYVIRKAASSKTHQPSSPCLQCLCSEELAGVTLFSLQDFPGINNGHSFLCATSQCSFPKAQVPLLMLSHGAFPLLDSWRKLSDEPY